MRLLTRHDSVAQIIFKVDETGLQNLEELRALPQRFVRFTHCVTAPWFVDATLHGVNC